MVCRILVTSALSFLVLQGKEKFGEKPDPSCMTRYELLTYTEVMAQRGLYIVESKLRYSKIPYFNPEGPSLITEKMGNWFLFKDVLVDYYNHVLGFCVSSTSGEDV